MRLAHLIELAAEFPVFTVEQAAAQLHLDPRRVREQLSRWRARGYVTRIGAGLWVLDPLAGGERIDAPLLAHLIDPTSAISTESALAYHGMTPLHPPDLTCVTPGRPRRIETPYGPIRYRHMAPHLWFDYQPFEYAPTFFAPVATPNKALLDLFHYVPMNDLDLVILDMRLNDWSPLEPWELIETAQAHYSPSIVRTARWACGMRRSQTGELDTHPTPVIRRIMERQRLRLAWETARRGDDDTGAPALAPAPPDAGDRANHP